MEPADARRLRYSYEMPTHTGMRARVGWDGDAGTYWFAIVRVSIGQDMRPEPLDFDDVSYTGGDELDRITNLAELVRRTWGEIYWWDSDPKILHLLRNDPVLDALHQARIDGEPYPLDVESYVVKTMDTFLAVPDEEEPRPASARPPVPPAGRRRFGQRDT